MEEPMAEAPSQQQVVSETSGSATVAVATGGPDAASSLSQRLRATLDVVGDRFNTGAWLYGVIGVVVVLALLLPPIALPERLGLVGYTTVNSDNSSISHADGITLGVDPDAFTGRIRVRLESVPRQRFMAGEAGAGLYKAAEALPSHLEVKSPYYVIETRGDSSQPVTVDVVVPANAEPWETLDLYTWTGEEWEWVGSGLHAEVAEHEFVRAVVTDIPGSIVMVQANSIPATVSASVGPADDWSAGSGVLDEVNPVGLILGTDGGFIGDVGSLPQASEEMPYAVLPTLRNWAPGASVNRGLLSDVLGIAAIQEAHIARIVQLCTEEGYAGVDVDYRGVASDQRDPYSGFMGELADALRSEELRLTVAVDRPTSMGGGWDTGGYDWKALGAVADAVKVPFPTDPGAYGEMGEAHRLVNWATSQIPRYKLRLFVSSLTVEQGESETGYISLEQAFAPFGDAVALNSVDSVEPGSQVEFGFSGIDAIRGIVPQDTAANYQLVYQAGDGQVRTVLLGTPASLSAKLNWALRFHLGGVAVADALSPGNMAGITDVLTNYRNGDSYAATPNMQVVWTVSSAATMVDQQASPLTEPGFTWTVLVAPGEYTVSSKVAGFDHGELSIVVAESPSVVALAPELDPAADAAAVEESLETEDAEETTEAEEPGEEPAGETADAEVAGDATVDCLKAAYVADVTIPDNTRLDKGEAFVKTWRMRNTGSCAWPEDTALAMVRSELGEPDDVQVGIVAEGETVEISVELVAPDQDGVFDGSWTLRTGDTDLPGGHVTAVIIAGEEGDAAPAPSAPIPVSGGSFELGGHVRDMGLPFAGQMHNAGMTWTKVQVHYGQDASGIIQGAHSQGFKIQLSGLGSSGMVTQSGFEQDIANWLAGLAAAGADAIEVWNEPNIDREWQIGHISPQAYTDLLCTSYRAIKAANAGTAVISAAPAPTGWFGGCSANGCDDLPWIQGMYNAGAANCMDYLGSHHNAGATSPSARSGHPADPSSTHHSWFFLPQTELYYNTFGGTRKLFYTEMGYASQEGLPTFSDQFSWARGTNNAQQAAWLAEAVQLSANTGMVRSIIVWNIDFVRYGSDPQDGFAIIRPGGGCPACDSLHNVLGTR